VVQLAVQLAGPVQEIRQEVMADLLLMPLAPVIIMMLEFLLHHPHRLFVFQNLCMKFVEATAVIR
jgi:hypothetical protein